MRTPCWAFVLLAALGTATSLPPATAQGTGPPPGATPGGDPLVREIEVDFSLTDADLAAAAKALQEESRLQVRIAGTPPDRKVTFAAKDLPIRRAADALAALYGVDCEIGGNVILFSLRRPETPVAAAARLLREYGLGGRFPPQLGDNGKMSAQVRQELLGFIPPDTLQRMLQADPKEASKLGIPVRDLPPDKQQRFLAWQLDEHRRNAVWNLNDATRPFDERLYLETTVCLLLPKGPDGPRTLVLEGGGLHMHFGLGTTRR
jgi:hypothetical protein